MPYSRQLIRAWWSRKQGLDGALAGKPCAEVLAHTGWARSVGGDAPYLTLFARCGASRAQVDADVAAEKIHELPAARGCTYVVPQRNYALALQVGEPFREPDMVVARKLGVTDREMEALNAAVLAALEAQELEPDELRAAVGSAVRSLGEAGKKKGLSTTLPLALGQLQARGEISRIPVDGRIDRQRYKYARWPSNPRAQRNASLEDSHTELAAHYFRWIGPASLAEFQWFSGLTAKAAKAAVAPLDLVPCNDGLLFPDDNDLLKSFQVPQEPQYALVSGLDAILSLRRSVQSLTDHNVPATIGQVQDLPHHAILDRGTLVGLWDYDPAAQEIVAKLFIAENAPLRNALHRTEEFVRQELGDARSFSLDSPKSRAGRLAALR